MTVLVMLWALGACTSAATAPEIGSGDVSTPVAAATPTASSVPTPVTTEVPTVPPTQIATAYPSPSVSPLPAGVARPAWLGTRPLPLDDEGQALSQPTPPELVVRRIPSIDILPAPPAEAPFASSIQPLEDDVVARSTWTPDCPVARAELAYVTVSFWGFDQRPHTGEIIVNASWAAQVVEIFGRLYDEQYPIEEMRIVSAAELEGTPTGDGNDTTGFVCRASRGSTSWSQHAYGLAIDINPFINPYERGQRILPELAGAYLDRTVDRPGMLGEESTAVQAFDDLGWGWGGRWTSLVDYMHFSANNR